MPTEVATVVVETTRTVQIEVPGPAYSNARVAAYLQGILTANGDLLTVAAGVLARVGVGSAPTGSVLTWDGTAWTVAAPATPTVSWSDITGKPSTFAPSSHTHVASEITDFATAWTARLTAAGSGATTGNALIWGGSSWAPGAYAYGNLSGVPATFAPSSHTHTASEVSDFSTAWTTRMTALGSGANPNDVLTWNGSAWAAAAPSGGGMSNPMTTEWDLIRGGSSGAPTRFAVGSLRSRLGVLGDGTLGYAPVPGVNASPRGVSGFSWATSTGSPATVGEITIARTATTVTNPGNRCYPVGTNFQRHQAATGSAPNRTTWIGQIGSLSNQWGRASASAYIFTRSMTSDQVIGVGIFTSGGAYAGLTITTATNSAVGADQQIWLRHRGGQTNYEFVTVAASGSVLVDTGVAYVVGVQTCLRVWQDVDGCCWQIWSATTNGAWTLLGEGYAATNPTNNTLGGYAQFAGSVGQSNVSGTAGDIEVNGVHVALLAMGSA